MCRGAEVESPGGVPTGVGGGVSSGDNSLHLEEALDGRRVGLRGRDLGQDRGEHVLLDRDLPNGAGVALEVTDAHRGRQERRGSSGQDGRGLRRARGKDRGGRDGDGGETSARTEGAR